MNREEWLKRQAEAGWPSYDRAVYAVIELGIKWPREDAPPACYGAYMKAWYAASRWRGGGLAPEDVRDEIEGSP